MCKFQEENNNNIVETKTTIDENNDEYDYDDDEEEDNDDLLNSTPTQFNIKSSSDSSSLDCKICNKQFENLHRLQRHAMSHDQNPELRKFKCEFCNKAFKFKHHLKVSVYIFTCTFD